MAALGELIPGATTVTVEGVGHELLCGAEMRGQPSKAIPAIRNFFSQGSPAAEPVAKA